MEIFGIGLAAIAAGGAAGFVGATIGWAKNALRDGEISFPEIKTLFHETIRATGYGLFLAAMGFTPMETFGFSGMTWIGIKKFGVKKK